MNFFNEYKALTLENDLHLQISAFETIRSFQIPFFPPFNLKYVQHIRTILFMRLKIHRNSYFTNTIFHREMLVL